MLEIRSITKSYTTGDFTQKALDDVSLSFRRNEFVAILGPSGSGKTTFLNVVGGLDKYDSGDLVINGRSTKEFSDADWDAYRNNTIGFVFQSYNLIMHLDVLANVEMGMTLSGLSQEEKRKKAEDALNRVGLKDHLHKKPNQLSGGQMQRVAIARALATDPDIILADEPTGALDTNTGRQIMELIKSIAGDKLVIMVTHNPEIANEYADRIVRFEDGRVVDDSDPYAEVEAEETYQMKRTSMSFPTAVKLSGRNIATKKGRTLLTAFASSIGIIGIALILSLSDGFKLQIEKYQGNALNEFPIIISQMMMQQADEEQQRAAQEQMRKMLQGERDFADTDYITFTHSTRQDRIHINDFGDEFMDFVDGIDASVCENVGYTRLVTMNALRKDASGKVNWYNFPTGISGMTEASATNYNMSGVGLASYPVSTDGKNSYLEKYYDLLSGAYPANATEAVVVVDNNNAVDETVMEALGFDISQGKMDFTDVIGTTFRLVGNDTFYQKSKDFGFYIQQTDYDAMWDADTNIEVRVVGILRLKAEQSVGLLGFGLAYSDELVQRVVELNQKSAVIQDLQTGDVDVTSAALTPLDDTTRSNLIARLGGSAKPFVIYLYPKTFEAKDTLIADLDAYNEGKDDDAKIEYIDLSEAITTLTGNIMDAVTIVLVAFASISLVVSLIMIAIITYISVLERTKEIGILRALGARKKDITRVFNAETFIIGLTSGVMGIVIAYLLRIPINMIIEAKTDLPNVAVLNPLYALGLIAISLVLTILGGFIPAKMAARKDPVTALRSE